MKINLWNINKIWVRKRSNKTYIFIQFGGIRAIKFFRRTRQSTTQHIRLEFFFCHTRKCPHATFHLRSTAHQTSTKRNLFILWIFLFIALEHSFKMFVDIEISIHKFNRVCILPCIQSLTQVYMHFYRIKILKYLVWAPNINSTPKIPPKIFLTVWSLLISDYNPSNKICFLCFRQWQSKCI